MMGTGPMCSASGGSMGLINRLSDIIPRSVSGFPVADKNTVSLLMPCFIK